MRALSEVAGFLRRIRRHLRFGEYSRSSLRLLRFELKEDMVECEWLARPNDPWDVHLPAHIREQNQTFQALRDALNIREALFKSIPGVQVARVRVYRQREETGLELIITGSINREDELPPRLSSLVMKAKLCGFRFNLSDGAFESLSTKASLQFANR